MSWAALAVWASLVGCVGMALPLMLQLWHVPVYSVLSVM